MPATLYFDGRCPLCRREMRHLQKLKSDQLSLADVHEIDLEEVMLEGENSAHARARLLRILHLRTANGDWLTGLDANVAAWSFTPIGFLFKPLRWPIIRQVADAIYIKWAEKRFCKLDY